MADNYADPADHHLRYVEEVCWAEIMKEMNGEYLLAGDDRPPHKACCPVCLDDMNLPGIPEPTGPQVPCQILPCGHICCDACLPHVLSLGVPRCPYCRFDLRCSICHSPAITHSVPTTDDPAVLAAVPKPNSGSDSISNPLICPHCALRDTWRDLNERDERPGDPAVRWPPGYGRLLGWMYLGFIEGDIPQFDATWMSSLFHELFLLTGDRMIECYHAYIDSQTSQPHSHPWFPQFDTPAGMENAVDDGQPPTDDNTISPEQAPNSEADDAEQQPMTDGPSDVEDLLA